MDGHFVQVVREIRRRVDDGLVGSAADRGDLLAALPDVYGSHERPVRSTKPMRESGSSMTIHPPPLRISPVGPCNASSRHSSTVSRGTGRVRSSRLRTERVEVSSRSVWTRSNAITRTVVGRIC